MELAALKTILTIREQGSMAGAGRVLDLDPSTVSRILAQVEAETGLRLFQRSTRKLSVTEEGARYLDRIAPLVSDFDAACEEALDARRAPRGTLRMTTSVAFAEKCIVPHLGAFRQAHPEISVELLPSDDNLDLIGEGLDLAVRLARAPKGDLIVRQLMPTRYRVVVAPDFVARQGKLANPVMLAGVECLRFTLPGYRSFWRFRDRNGAVIEVSIAGKLLISNALALRAAACQGLGPCLLADWLIREDLAAGRLIDLFPDYDCTATSFDTAAWLLYPSRSYLPGKTRAMVDFLRAHVPQAHVK
ncbi:MAG: LysR family transcriptional regulator [Pseudomonadota bacterium]